jgi:hypothetical protein
VQKERAEFEVNRIIEESLKGIALGDLPRVRQTKVRRAPHKAQGTFDYSGKFRPTASA